MLRPAAQEWVDLPDAQITAMYRDTVGDALYVCVDDRIEQFRAGDRLNFVWKSQQMLSHLTDFAVARVTGTYPLTFKLYKDGALRMTKAVTSDEPFKLPGGLARQWEVEVSGGGELLGVAIATAEGEI